MVLLSPFIEKKKSSYLVQTHTEVFIGEMIMGLSFVLKESGGKRNRRGMLGKQDWL